MSRTLEKRLNIYLTVTEAVIPNPTTLGPPSDPRTNPTAQPNLNLRMDLNLTCNSETGSRKKSLCYPNERPREKNPKNSNRAYTNVKDRLNIVTRGTCHWRP